MSLDPDTNLLGDWNAIDDNNQPPGADPRKEGDNQLRGIKGSLKRTFPNFIGSPGGVVNTTEEELNQLDGIGTTQTVEARLAALEAGSAKFPGGGVVALMFRNQVSAIPGWTQATGVEYDNAILRVINTADALSQGGSNNPISMSGAEVPAHPHAVNLSGDGEHNHGILNGWSGGTSFTRQIVATTPLQNVGNIPEYDDTGNWIDPSVIHSHSGNTDNNTGPAAWEPKYFDTIVASKD